MKYFSTCFGSSAKTSAANSSLTLPKLPFCPCNIMVLTSLNATNWTRSRVFLLLPSPSSCSIEEKSALPMPIMIVESGSLKLEISVGHFFRIKNHAQLFRSTINSPLSSPQLLHVFTKHKTRNETSPCLKGITKNHL